MDVSDEHRCLTLIPTDGPQQFSDGNKGIVLFRGYTPTQLQSCDFEDVFYLMVWKDLPTNKQREILRHSLAEAMCNIPSSVVDTINSFP